MINSHGRMNSTRQGRSLVERQHLSGGQREDSPKYPLSNPWNLQMGVN